MKYCLKIQAVCIPQKAEQYFNGEYVEDTDPSPDFMQVEALDGFFKSRNWVTYRTELSIFHKCYKLAGQADLLCRDESGGIVIVDWKRCREIKYENRWMSMKPPLHHLPETNYWTYALQLNLYLLMLEEEMGFSVSGMYLVCVHPERSAPLILEVPRMTTEIDSLRPMLQELNR